MNDPELDEIWKLKLTIQRMATWAEIIRPRSAAVERILEIADRVLKPKPKGETNESKRAGETHS